MWHLHPRAPCTPATSTLALTPPPATLHHRHRHHAHASQRPVTTVYLGAAHRTHLHIQGEDGWRENTRVCDRFFDIMERPLVPLLDLADSDRFVNPQAELHRMREMVCPSTQR